MGLYGRTAILQLGTEGDEGRLFTDLRITFRVKSTRKSTPNEATIQLFNPAPDTISLAQDPDAVIRLFAGYDAPQLIFQGNPTKNGVKMIAQGPDRILTIEAQDGLRAYQDARVSVSFTTQTTLQQVYDEVAAQMGLPQGTIRVDASFRFTQGGVFSGAARDVMDRIAASTSSGWFIRDGTLQLVGDAEDTGARAVLFSSDSGNLIGAPTVTDKGVEVTAMLAPTIRPGMPFRVESLYVNGDYIADVVEFTGDNQGGAFQVKATGVAT